MMRCRKRLGVLVCFVSFVTSFYLYACGDPSAAPNSQNQTNNSTPNLDQESDLVKLLGDDTQSSCLIKLTRGGGFAISYTYDVTIAFNAGLSVQEIYDIENNILGHAAQYYDLDREQMREILKMITASKLCGSTVKPWKSRDMTVIIMDIVINGERVCHFEIPSTMEADPILLNNTHNLLLLIQSSLDKWEEK